MSALLEQIQSSLLNLVGDGVRLMPGYLCAVPTGLRFALNAILLITRYIARFTQRLVTIAARRTVQSLSLQSLFIQTSDELRDLRSRSV